MIFSPNNIYLATGSVDLIINLVEISSKKIYHKFDKIHKGIYIYLCIYIHVLKIFIDTVRSLAFSGDSKYLATGSYD